jgi:hypothetical protein
MGNGYRRQRACPARREKANQESQSARPPTTILRWERGETQPDDVYVYLLCRLFDKPPDELDLEEAWSFAVDPRYARLSDHSAAAPYEDDVNRCDFNKLVICSADRANRCSDVAC